MTARTRLEAIVQRVSKVRQGNPRMEAHLRARVSTVHRKAAMEVAEGMVNRVNNNMVKHLRSNMVSRHSSTAVDSRAVTGRHHNSNILAAVATVAPSKADTALLHHLLGIKQGCEALLHARTPDARGYAVACLDGRAIAFRLDGIRKLSGSPIRAENAD